jgi:hypothetical protein
MVSGKSLVTRPAPSEEGSQLKFIVIFNSKSD